MTLRETVRTLLKSALQRQQPGVQFRSDKRDYVADIRNSFVPGVSLGAFRGSFSSNDFRNMHAVYSSASLVFNAFSPWANVNTLKHLVIGNFSGFRWLWFEHQFPNGLGTTAPHLDVALEYEFQDQMVSRHDVSNNATGGQQDNSRGKTHKKGLGLLGIESKLTEHLNSQYETFRDRYDRIACFQQLKVIAENPQSLNRSYKKWKYLGVKQLIAHVVGLEYSSRDKYDEVGLLYLYWEPLPGSASIAEQWRIDHKNEVDRFRDLYSRTCWSARVKFIAMSYLDLWNQWAGLPSPLTQFNHVHNLRTRYEFPVP